MNAYTEQRSKDRAALWQDAVDVLEQEGYESSFRPDYSGRGMYGDTCPAIVTDAPAALISWAIMCSLFHNSEDNGDTIVDSKHLIPTRSDSMGLSSIYY